MSKRLFVGNVNPAVTEAQLVEFFSAAGRVVSVSIPLDRQTGTPRGFAFVELATTEQAEEAIGTLDDMVLGGRRVRLRMAFEERRRAGGGNLRALPRGFEPAGADDALGDQPDWREQGGVDYSAGQRGKRHKRGKHGSDRIRGQGTRRVIE